MHLDTTFDVEFPATAALTRDLPRDQALGLRLMAMARAAAATHMGMTALGMGIGERAETEHTAQEGAERPQLLRSQASGLVGMMREMGWTENAGGTEKPGSESRDTWSGGATA